MSLTNAESGPPMAKPKTLDETWIPQDYKAVMATIKAIVNSAETFDAFESDFLTETLRCATRFRATFRLTPKQIEMLALLEARYALNAIIKAKTVPPTAEEALINTVLTPPEDVNA